MAQQRVELSLSGTVRFDQPVTFSNINTRTSDAEIINEAKVAALEDGLISAKEAAEVVGRIYFEPDPQPPTAW